MSRPRRTKTEQIEDSFADLTVQQQAQCLIDLAKLHRWTIKLRPAATLDTTEPVNGQLPMEGTE